MVFMGNRRFHMFDNPDAVGIIFIRKYLSKMKDFFDMFERFLLRINFSEKFSNMAKRKLLFRLLPKLLKIFFVDRNSFFVFVENDVKFLFCVDKCCNHSIGETDTCRTLKFFWQEMH